MCITLMAGMSSVIYLEYIEYNNAPNIDRLKATQTLRQTENNLCLYVSVCASLCVCVLNPLHTYMDTQIAVSILCSHIVLRCKHILIFDFLDHRLVFNNQDICTKS